MKEITASNYLQAIKPGMTVRWDKEGPPGGWPEPRNNELGVIISVAPELITIKFSEHQFNKWHPDWFWSRYGGGLLVIEQDEDEWKDDFVVGE